MVVEDDSMLGDALRAGLRQQGFQVDWVRDGLAAERELGGGAYLAAVLDLGLPLQDGLQVLRQVRAAGVVTPILVLTARDAIAQRIVGLDAGADDYVVKPVDLHELAARLRSLIRRSHGQAQDKWQCADIVLDVAKRQVCKDGEPVLLSAREFDVLQALMRHPGQVVTRAQLAQQLYSWGQEVESNAVEVHVHHLRRKLGSDAIITVRGVGYAMRIAVGAQERS
nr:response regulator transcription factor [Curvibacter sp. CHRR-16]